MFPVLLHITVTLPLLVTVMLYMPSFTFKLPIPPIAATVLSETAGDVMLITVLLSVNISALYRELHRHTPCLQHSRELVPLLLTVITLP